MENYCIECEELIEKPSLLSGFAGDKSPKAKKFKKGWKCGHCYQEGKR